MVQASRISTCVPFTLRFLSAVQSPVQYSNPVHVFYNIRWEDGKLVNFKALVPNYTDEPTLIKTLSHRISTDPQTNYGKKSIHISKIVQLSTGRLYDFLFLNQDY